MTHRYLPIAAALIFFQTGTPVSEEAACRALLETPNVTVTYAVLKAAAGAIPQHCYIQGSIEGRIRFHMQLPLRANWNRRLLNIGDGGKDGDLDFDNRRLAQGYAVANSNTGHDAGSTPRGSFGHENPHSLIDFAYRAVHLTANASKAVVRAYYREPQQFAYFEGCSTGGRQGLMEAQRYPDDFDGIVAGAPVFDYQALNTGHVWMAQRVFKDNFSGNLVFDKDRDGVPESLTKWEILRDTVLNKCDGKDGIKDGLIDHPPSCDFNPDRDLAAHMCAGDRDADNCFTRRQLQTIKDLYRGPHDSKGVRIMKGMDFGSEYDWNRTMFPHKGNNMLPAKLIYGVDHVNFLFYEQSPGVPMPNPTDLTQRPDKTATPPEFAWWEFNIDDVTAGKGRKMSSLTDATDTDLSRFLKRENGKLVLYHGWADPEGQAEPTQDYYTSMVQNTFNGDIKAAREKARLFMIPGMGHCEGGPGLSSWDRLAPLVDWVENGKAPDYVVGEHITNGRVDNQRKVCAYPQRAVYAGPAGGENNPANWVEKNFLCR